MYLKDLNDAQKALVLDLLIHTASSDGSENSAEHARIAQSCAEMGITPRFSAKLPEDAALKLFTEISNTITMRKVLVELTILAMSDMEYDELERAFTNRYASLTGMRQEDFEEVLRLLAEIAHAKQRLDELVNEPI